MGILLISIFILFIILLSISIIYFLSPVLSPIPYFPTNKNDVNKIISILLKGNKKDKKHTIIDLGAGTGAIVFETAKHASKKKLNTQFVAVEINPVLVVIMVIRRLFHPNRTNIQIIRKDMFRVDLQEFAEKDVRLTIYLYISPWHMNRLIPQLCRLPKNTQIVSYMYKIKKLQNKLVNTHKGVNLIYEYRI